MVGYEWSNTCYYQRRSVGTNRQIIQMLHIFHLKVQLKNEFKEFGIVKKTKENWKSQINIQKP